MKVKLSIIIFTVILSVFYLQIVSCNRVTNPNKAINEIDIEYLRPGQYQKTLGYKFDNDFIFYGWTNQEVITKKKVHGGDAIEVRKIVSSKYFDVWVDKPNCKKAVNIKDTIWYELIKDLKELYPKVMSIYGTAEEVVDLTREEYQWDKQGGLKYKIEIIFHEYHNKFKDNTWSGYFSKPYITNFSINSSYLTNGIKSTDSKYKYTELKYTIIHELQHYINYYYRNYNANDKYYCYNEALSESTYNVILGESSLYRHGNFEASSNGQYFFDWDLYNPPTNAAANYRTAAGFMYWLYIHGGGEKIIKDIVRNKEINHKAIADAARRNIPYFAGKDYNSLIFSWHKANFYNNSSGLLGYKGKVTISLRLASASDGKISLQPQCAIYTTQDVYDRNKNIGNTNIWLDKLSDGSRKWLLIYNGGSKPVTVYTKNGGGRIPTWGKDKSWGHIKPNPIKLIR